MADNDHGGYTGDLMQDALDLCVALVAKRVIEPHGLRKHDGEDAIQDFTAYVLGLLDRYDPERAKLSTFIYTLFWQWDSQRQKDFIARATHEMAFDPLPSVGDEKRQAGESDLEMVATLHGVALESSHDFSDRALRLVEALPERIRGPVVTHIAYGASLTATAEVHGISDRTVSRHVKQARQIWREQSLAA